VREKARPAEARIVDAGVAVWNDGTIEQLEKEVRLIVKMLEERERVLNGGYGYFC
jgi:hypothetical protein